jgi:hypothetical protein
MYYEVIQKYFPATLDEETYFGSSFRLFSNTNKRILKPEKNLIKSVTPQTTNEEFFGEIKLSVEKVYRKIEENQYILLQTQGFLESNSPLFYVVTLERNGEMVKNGDIPLLYAAYDQAKLNDINANTIFFNAFNLPEEALPSDLIKIYFWNPEKAKVQIGETKIYFEKN